MPGTFVVFGAYCYTNEFCNMKNFLLSTYLSHCFFKSNLNYSLQKTIWPYYAWHLGWQWWSVCSSVWSTFKYPNNSSLDGREIYYRYSWFLHNESFGSIPSGASKKLQYVSVSIDDYWLKCCEIYYWKASHGPLTITFKAFVISWPFT